MMDEKIYQFGLYVLLFFEGILAIPLAIDSMMGSDGQNIIIFVLVVHLVMWTYGEVGRLHRLNKTIHIIGLVAFIISFVPLVGFILHFIVIYLILRDIIRRSRENRKRELDQS